MKAKIVFITGASSGIGEGCARKFAKEGWNLILNARTVSKLEELKAELEKEYGIQVYVLPFDVRDRKQAAAALEALPEEWKSIDVLINNAGLVGYHDRYEYKRFARHDTSGSSGHGGTGMRTHY